MSVSKKKKLPLEGTARKLFGLDKKTQSRASREEQKHAQSAVKAEVASEAAQGRVINARTRRAMLEEAVKRPGLDAHVDLKTLSPEARRVLEKHNRLKTSIQDNARKHLTITEKAQRVAEQKRKNALEQSRRERTISNDFKKISRGVITEASVDKQRILNATETIVSGEIIRDPRPHAFTVRPRIEQPRHLPEPSPKSNQSTPRPRVKQKKSVEFSKLTASPTGRVTMTTKTLNGVLDKNVIHDEARVQKHLHALTTGEPMRGRKHLSIATDFNFKKNKPVQRVLKLN